MQLQLPRPGGNISIDMLGGGQVCSSSSSRVNPMIVIIIACCHSRVVFGLTQLGAGQASLIRRKMISLPLRNT